MASTSWSGSAGLLSSSSAAIAILPASDTWQLARLCQPAGSVVATLAATTAFPANNSKTRFVQVLNRSSSTCHVARCSVIAHTTATWQQERAPHSCDRCMAITSKMIGKKKTMGRRRRVVSRGHVDRATSATWQQDRARQPFGRCVHCQAAAAGASADCPRQQSAAILLDWLEKKGLGGQQAVSVADYEEQGQGLGCQAVRDIKAGDVALKIPEHLVVTGVDVASHPTISQAAAGRGDLIGLTLWLLAERAMGKKSQWHPYVNIMPKSTLSPLLWSAEERESLLKGSPVLDDVNGRIAALEDEFEELASAYFRKDPEVFPLEFFSLENFKACFSMILSRVTYLPSADCFALIPFGDFVNHSSGCEACFDYSMEEKAAVLVADRPYQQGEQVYVTYGQDRPNSELLISYGFVDQRNLNDYLEVEVSLVAGDSLFSIKRQVLEQWGLSTEQSFPLFPDRFPSQLLSYLRLARLTDAAKLPQVVFDKDLVIDQANEYEVLMLLMADCRDRLSKYSSTIDDDTRLLRDKNLGTKERVAAQLRLCEQGILTSTMTALRARLAPIRGIPTKSGGLQDPNADIKQMFDQVEEVASAPRRFFSNIFRKGE